MMRRSFRSALSGRTFEYPNDRRKRPIVVFKTMRRAAECRFEVRHVLRFRTPEPINRLASVGHYPYIGARVTNLTQQSSAGRVDVLVFIDENMLETGQIVLYVLVCANEFNCQRHEIAEIDGVRVAQRLLIYPVNFGISSSFSACSSPSSLPAASSCILRCRFVRGT